MTKEKLPNFDETIAKAVERFRITSVPAIADAANEETLVIVKPDAIREVAAIISMIEAAGLKIGQHVESMVLSRGRALELYAEHAPPAKAAPPAWLEEHLAFMTSGPVVAFSVVGPDAPARVRALAGATDPQKAAPGTIRARFGSKLPRNAIHASDSPASAAREIALLFPGRA